MPRPARWTFTTLLLLSLGCSGWTRLPEGMPRQPANFRLFEVWAGEERHLWHAVRAEGDSLTGIPATESIECDRCRIGVATAEVDSVRAGGTDSSTSTGFAFVAGGIIGSLLMLIGLLSAVNAGT